MTSVKNLIPSLFSILFATTAQAHTLVDRPHEADLFHFFTEPDHLAIMAVVVVGAFLVFKARTNR